MAAARKQDRVLGPYYKGRNRWRIVVIGDDGTRIDRVFSSEARALQEKAAFLEQLEATAGVTFRLAIEKYETHLLVEKENRPRPVEETIRRLTRMFANHLDVPVASLATKEHGLDLYEKLRAYRIPQKNKPRDQWKGYSAASHRNVLIESRTFLRWCIEKKYTKVNVLADIKGTGKRRRGADKPQLTIDEAKRWTAVAWRLIDELSEGAMAAILSEYLDIRCTEIVTRRVRDIDAGGTVLRVTRSTTKTDAGERSLEVPEEIRPVLQFLARGKGPHDFLFGKGKKARDRNYPSKWCAKICVMAGVPVVRAHAMRRLHATIAAEHGATGHIIARAMGHKSFSTTVQSYIKRGTVERVQRSHALRLIQGGERHGPQKLASEAPAKETPVPSAATDA